MPLWGRNREGKPTELDTATENTAVAVAPAPAEVRRPLVQADLDEARERLENPFGEFEREAWPHRFRCTLHLTSLAGGIPSDKDTAEAWIRSKVDTDKEGRIRQLIAETMVERGITLEEATDVVNKLRHLNGFKRDDFNGLYIEGRQVKAAIKEAASVAAASGALPLRNWGVTNKYLHSFVAEHIMVPDEIIYLGKSEPDGVAQSFPENKRIGQRGIQMTEYVRDVTISFRVISDWDFTKRDWAMIWLKGGEEGIGACRSQGFGRYQPVGWETL